MKTDEFNEHYEINRKAKGLSADPKTLEYRTPAPVYTADNEVYDQDENYFFFDSANIRVRRSSGMQRIGEHLCVHGLKVVAVAKLFANQDDAITAAQDFLRSEITRNEKRIEKLEAAKTSEKRKLKNFSIVNRD